MKYHNLGKHGIKVSKISLGTKEQIGILFALGNVAIGVGTLLAPFVSSRLDKVRAVAFTELISIPFIFGIAFSPNLGSAAGPFLARGAL